MSVIDITARLEALRTQRETEKSCANYATLLHGVETQSKAIRDNPFPFLEAAHQRIARLEARLDAIKYLLYPPVQVGWQEDAAPTDFKSECQSIVLAIRELLGREL